MSDVNEKAAEGDEDFEGQRLETKTEPMIDPDFEGHRVESMIEPKFEERVEE